MAYRLSITTFIDMKGTLMTETRMLPKSDRVGMYLAVGIGAIGIVLTAAQAIARLGEVAPGHDIPVLVPFVDESATLPIGPGGAPLEVAVDQAIVTVPDPAAATLFALWAEPIVVALAIIAGIVVGALFCLRLAGGRAFERGTARLILIGTGILAVGWFVGTMLTNMTVNGALSAVSDYTYDGVVFSTDFVPLFGVLALAAIGAAFQIGERLQRDTEGLV
jgi:hypothetical protein